MSHLASPVEPIRVGNTPIQGKVLLAPMSGVTDAPFRRLAHALGAPLVVTEMIASDALARERPDMVRRAEGSDIRPFVVQLAGREARWMGEGARIATDFGADIVDINMGCPAKQVTKGLSGSALMRDLDHALTLIEATVAATDRPVTLKMRMGWDERNLNAPELARRAEAAGVRMITVHGRTRCQLFNGRADWAFIARVKAAVAVPVIANGDIVSLDDIQAVLTASKADGIMIGRGAFGRPWLPGRAAQYLATGRDPGDPSIERRKVIALSHYDAMLSHYGIELGTRTARKHLGWYVEQAAAGPADVKRWRERLCRQDDPAVVRRGLSDFYDMQMELAA